ncbi:MAG TPA: head protein [Myxococcaceae bacterium]|nr:head protein [Myxococcaceae bacterium]
MSRRELSVEVMDLLARFRADSQSPREQELLAVAINAFLFISSTGQSYAFEDFLHYLESSEPPPVVAAFDTREEAESWLHEHSSPPDSALVLISDQYHLVVYNRETNLRRLIPHSAAIEYHLGYLKQGGLPPPVASFETRAEAEAWLESQPEPPRQAVIRIAGEDHLAVHHRSVNRRAIYPFSQARAVKE